MAQLAGQPHADHPLEVAQRVVQRLEPAGLLDVGQRGARVLAGVMMTSQEMEGLDVLGELRQQPLRGRLQPLVVAPFVMDVDQHLVRLEVIGRQPQALLQGRDDGLLGRGDLGVVPLRLPGLALPGRRLGESRRPIADCGQVVHFLVDAASATWFQTSARARVRSAGLSVSTVSRSWM